MKKLVVTVLMISLTGILLTGCGKKHEETESVKVSEAASQSVMSDTAESSEAASVSSPQPTASATPTPTLTPTPTTAPVDLTQHVQNIRDFSLTQGTIPDPMSGISWDSSISTVTCDTGSADWNTPGTYPVNYTITGKDGRTAQKQVNATVEIDLEQYLYGMEGDAEISVGQSFDPMAHVTHDDEITSITPDTKDLNTSKAGEYLISYQLTGQNGKTQTAVRKITVQDPSAGTAAGQAEAGYSTVTDLGIWRLTAYMDTPADQGAYVGQTASGSPLVAGETVAVSQATCARLNLHFGDKLMIDGHIYTLEDYGGSAMNDQNWVDIFVSNATDEYSEQYNKYTEVYLLR